MKKALLCRSHLQKCFNIFSNRNVHIATDISKIKSFDSIPGPKPVPIFGNFWRYIPGIGTYSGMGQHEENIRHNEKFGDLVRLRGLIFRPDLILCYNPDDIATVFRNEGPTPVRDFVESLNYYRLKMRNDIFQGFPGVFASVGEQWQNSRSIVNKIMMQTKTVKHYVDPVGHVADDFINHIEKLRKQSPISEMPANFDYELNKWSLESVAYMMLDKRIGIFEKTNSEAENYLNNVLEYMDLIYEIDVKPNMWKYISTKNWRKYVKVSDSMGRFLKKHVDAAMSNIDMKNYNDASIFWRLLNEDRKYLFGIITDMMIAGVDTTSKTMGSTLYYLASNPDVQEKLRKEVMSVLPTADTPITSESLDRMPYLRATIKETMRLAPIAIGPYRRLIKDLVLSGYHVPKGTHVLMCNLALGRKNEYFPEAEKFLPNRWMRTDGSRAVDVNPWVYLPFAQGPRACVGKRLALLEMEVLLAKIIRKYKMSWAHDEMKFKMIMIYSCSDPLKIKMEPFNN